MADPELTIVMPVYNERPTVLEVLRRVRELPVNKEIIIVDNCSTDGTRELLQGLDYPDVKVVLQPQNMRKGNSVRRGIGLAQGEYLVVQDGDLEYEPQDLLRLLAEAKREGVLAVIGSRLLGAQERGEAVPRTVFRLGANLINWVFQTLYRSRLTDIASCYKLAPTAVLKSLDLRCDGFDLDYETAGKLLLLARHQGQEVIELPVQYRPRTVAEGKKIRWHDGLKALGTLWRARLWKPAAGR